jgi:hypothetical protein
MGKKMKIELLYFEDCPSWKAALDNLQMSMMQSGISEEVVLLQVGTQAEAEAKKFTGSPTIRVNGEDLFPPERANFALACRVYQTPDGLKGWPTEEMILEKLQPINNGN